MCVCKCNIIYFTTFDLLTTRTMILKHDFERLKTMLTRRLKSDN